jgi:hypothetical protein
MMCLNAFISIAFRLKGVIDSLPNPFDLALLHRLASLISSISKPRLRNKHDKMLYLHVVTLWEHSLRSMYRSRVEWDATYNSVTVIAPPIFIFVFQDAR